MIFMIILIMIPMTSGALYFAYAQSIDVNNGTNTMADNPGAIYVTFLTTAASMIIAILTAIGTILKSKALQGKISTVTIEQLMSAKEILMNLVQKSETAKQFADVVYYQLLPEKAKEIAGAYAIKTSELNKALEKDVIAVNELGELIKKWEGGEVKDPAVVANLMKSIIARNEQKVYIDIDQPEEARVTITDDRAYKKSTN